VRGLIHPATVPICAAPTILFTLETLFVYYNVDDLEVN